MSSTSEFLTNQFYAWEQRGRGWHTFAMPVALEPHFCPFYGHIPPPISGEDDSYTPNIFSQIAAFFKPPVQKVQVQQTPKYLPIRATVFECEEKLTVFSVQLPKDAKIRTEDMRHLLTMLSLTHYPLSFEIVATSTNIGIQIACRESDSQTVYSQTKAYFPLAAIAKHDEGLEILAAHTETYVLDFGLAQECMRPLKFASDLERDPFIGIFATLEHLQKNERGIIQVLFQGSSNPWAASILRSVTGANGNSFFADAPEMVKLAQEKVASTLYSVCIRVAGQAAKNDRAIDIAFDIGAAVMHATSSKSNQLRLLPNERYPTDEQITDIYLRETHRIGMILNVDELASIVHFPTNDVVSAKLARDTRKTKQAPSNHVGKGCILGINSHNGEDTIVRITNSQRLRHTHLIGATGTGKSTLLLSMIAQDMQGGNGIAVLDPHGDLIESILAHVPENRINDVILIDPSDGEFPVGFNILSAHSEIEKDILSSDLVAVFKRLSTSWGDQMNSVFANAILAFLESTEGGTLMDLRRFLVEKQFRDTYLKTISDQNVIYYWQHEYPLLKSNSIGSILTRLDTFLRPKLIRNMVAQKKGLDFENILDTQKILLIKLSQGLIGAENSYLLGTFFVSKIYQAAMARQSKQAQDRNDFFLYCDEFQNFITPSMSYILSGARKYHLGLILAHQDMAQLNKYDSELASAIVVNAGTRVCFRLGDVDARRFASGFSYFDAADLENLKTGEAIARVEQPNLDFNLSTLPVKEVPPDEAERITQAVITQSRFTYGTPRKQVEESITFVPTPVHERTEKKIKKPEPAQEAAPPQAPFVPVIVQPKETKTKKANTEHRYLQMLVKKIAEARGYRAAIEEATPDGNGRVDVSLERNGKKIAVEISVTTPDLWEVHNVKKCLAAGYDEVIVCSSDTKNLQRVREQLERKLPKEQQAKVMTFEPSKVIQFFDTQVVQEFTTEKVIKGYRVKVEFDTSTAEEMNRKKENIIEVVSKIKRK